MSDWTIGLGGDIPEGAEDILFRTEDRLDNIIDDESLMGDVAGSISAMQTVAHSAHLMDEVSNSETSMDSLAGSETAINAVSEVDSALQVLLLSEYVEDSVWPETIATEGIWKQGRPRPPTTIEVGDSDVDIGFSGTSEGGSSIHIEVTNFSDDGNTTDGDYTIIDSIDLTKASTITFSTRTDNGFDNDYDWEISAGSATLEVGDPHDWTSRSLDVSDETGSTEFKTTFGVRENAGSQDWEIKNIKLD